MGVGRPYRDVGIQSGRHDDLISTLLCILQLGVRVIGVGLHGVLDTRLSVFANVTCVEWAVAGSQSRNTNRHADGSQSDSSYT